MPTIKDIAKAAGVSPASVSRVINNGPKVGDEVRARIKKIMDEMGYYPNANAQALITRNNDSIGIVLADLTDPFFAAIAHGIERVATEKNIQLFMNSGAFENETELKAIETLLEHRYKAMVVHSAALDDKTLIKFANKIPGFILFNRYIKEIEHRCVWLDDEVGGQLIAEYLVEQGHKDIAIITTDTTRNNTLMRLNGVQQALNKHQISIPDEAIEYNSASYEGGEIAIQNLLAKGIKFTAVIAYNDAMAVGAIAMLEAHGLKVPQDISVTGFDNLILAKCSKPKLTTIHNPIEEMSIQATKLALKYNQNAPTKVNKTYRYIPTLVVRESVKSLKD